MSKIQRSIAYQHPLQSKPHACAEIQQLKDIRQEYDAEPENETEKLKKMLWKEQDMNEQLIDKIIRLEIEIEDKREIIEGKTIQMQKREFEWNQCFNNLSSKIQQWKEKHDALVKVICFADNIFKIELARIEKE